MTTPTIRSLVVFDQLKVGSLTVEPKRVKATYQLTKPDGSQVENELIYSYEEKVFDPNEPADVNLASMIVAQVALNYGLFCKKIVFEGVYDESDRRFLTDMMENTSREIYVLKFLHKNEFLKPPFDSLPVEKMKRYTAAELVFRPSDQATSSHPSTVHLWQLRDTDPDQFVILSSGGKDSLLTYGIIKELGKGAHPVFINEAGRHWFTAINSHRHLQATEPNTSRVWCNSDRIFTWVLRHMPFIREDFANVRADIYPIRLWTVAVFGFGTLPIARKRRAGNVLVGDEYDTTIRTDFQGITHYAGLFDQSKYFDNALTRYYLKKGWNMFQYSLLRSLGELLILKILVKRYPELQQHQISCHASHERDGRIFPCGKCEKCRRIIGMLRALDEDPGRCGYSPEQIQAGLADLEKRSVKQIGMDAAHLYHLLLEKDLLAKNEHTKRLAKQHPHIMQLRFDRERSNLADLPRYIRQPVLDIFAQYADGSAKMERGKWTEFELTPELMQEPLYPFEFSKPKKLQSKQHEFLWEKMTWQEIEERLKTVDTAILPCGAIEQHGPHLPVDIDFFDATYLASKVAEACSNPKPFVLPPIPYGVSYHHEDFKGTLSVTNDALSRFVYDIGMGLARNGIKKILILNGHGDNAPTLSYAAQMINRDSGIFVCVETGETSDTDLSAICDTPNDIHAGDIETSTTLAIRPEIVQMDKAVNETLEFGSSYLDFSSERGVSWYVRTKKISESGVMGDATKATAEKGRKMWQIMISHLVQFVEEIKKSKLEELYQKRY